MIITFDQRRFQPTVLIGRKSIITGRIRRPAGRPVNGFSCRFRMLRLTFSDMSFLRNLLLRFGLSDARPERTPISVFLLDDDRRRHRWFEKRFSGDQLDIAETVDAAKEFLSKVSYDAIFLDHDLLPHHYETNDHNDYANTGFAIAEWLTDRSDLQRAATIIVHTRNADAAIPMVQKLRETGRNVEYVAFPMLDLKIRNYWKR